MAKPGARWQEGASLRHREASLGQHGRGKFCVEMLWPHSLLCLSGTEGLGGFVLVLVAGSCSQPLGKRSALLGLLGIPQPGVWVLFLFFLPFWAGDTSWVARCRALRAPLGLCCAQQEQESSSPPGCPARGARGAPSLLLRGSAASLPAQAGGLRCCCSAFRSPARRAALSCPSPRHCQLPSNQFLLLFSQGWSSVTRLSQRGFSLLYVLPSLRALHPRAHPRCHDIFGACCA